MSREKKKHLFHQDAGGKRGEGNERGPNSFTSMYIKINGGGRRTFAGPEIGCLRAETAVH